MLLRKDVLWIQNTRRDVFLRFGCAFLSVYREAVNRGCNEKKDHPQGFHFGSSDHGSLTCCKEVLAPTLVEAFPIIYIHQYFQFGKNLRSAEITPTK